MPEPSTTHLVVNTGLGALEQIEGFGAEDQLGLVGFFSPGPAADGVRQSVVAEPAGGTSLQVEVFEAGASEPAAVVRLVGVDHALPGHALLH